MKRAHFHIGLEGKHYYFTGSKIKFMPNKRKILKEDSQCSEKVTNICDKTNLKIGSGLCTRECVYFIEQLEDVVICSDVKNY